MPYFRIRQRVVGKRAEGREETAGNGQPNTDVAVNLTGYRFCPIGPPVHRPSVLGVTFRPPVLVPYYPNVAME